MRSRVLVIILLIVTGTLPPAHGQAPRIASISSPSDLQPDDSMDWQSATQGHINVYFGGPFKISSGKGNLIQISGPQEFEVTQWRGWHLPARPSGPYVPSPDDLLLSARFEAYHGLDSRYEGVPPISFEFSTPIKGMGMRIISWDVSTPPRTVLGFPGRTRLTVSMRVFDDANKALASFSGVSEGSNPMYVGVLSRDTNIQRIEISSDTEYPELFGRKHVANNFLIGQVVVSTGQLRPCCYSTSPNFPTIAVEPVSAPPVAQSSSQPAPAANRGGAQTTSAQPPQPTPPSGPSVTVLPHGAPPKIAAVSQGKAEVKIGNVFYTLATDKAEYGPDEPVNLTFTVTNAGKGPATFEFSSTQPYDFQVLNGTTQIMRWPSGQMFGKKNQTLTLAPGGSLIDTTNWPQTGPDQKVISPGEYRIKVVFPVKDGPVEVYLAFRRLAPTSPPSPASPVQPSPPPPPLQPTPALVTPGIFGISKQYSEIRKGDTVYTLASDKVEYGAKDRVDLTFKITNVGKEGATFTFPTGQQYDFVVTRGTTEIAKWSSGKTLSPEALDVVLDPGKSLNFQTRWSQEDMHRQVITPGQYEITATFLAKDNEVTVPLSFQRVRANTPPPPTSVQPAPSPAPTTPAPAQAAPTHATAPAPHAPAPPAPPRRTNIRTTLVIQPGLGIGTLTLGMSVHALEAKLGPNKGVQIDPDGTAVYRWFEPPKNAGVGARIAHDGMVQRMWILNDDRYATREGLHVGSTEAEVRSVLGAPSAVIENQHDKTRTLRYGNLGLWFIIQLDKQFIYYDRVFDIGVMPKQ